jgi:glucosamine-6-phosphate deaminase
MGFQSSLDFGLYWNRSFLSDESERHMLIKILPSPEAAELYVAELIADQVRAQPASVLGLATGGTMLGVYHALRNMDLSFKHTRAFNLDEYLGLSPAHAQSYHSYMRHHLFGHIDIETDHCHIPVGVGDVDQSIADYETLLTRYGPIDLQLLGLGQNGHIGFNEPGCKLDGTVHKTALSPTTIEANARYFDTLSEVPSEAITMGVGTIMSARKIVLLACGAAKADAVSKMIECSVTPECPASALQRHPNVEIVLDVAAASGLKNTKL